MIAVGAVIVEDGKVVLGKHVPERKGFWSGKWICPGGRLELGEAIKDGVAREVKEETHLDIEVQDFVLTFERFCQDNGEDVHVIYIDFCGKVLGGSLKADSDLGEARWVPITELPDIVDEIHEDTIVLLRKAGLMD
jgi:8-oxo-dGTP diphosphatase